ncbi:MAG TPA: DNA polymerase III subunit gamma/tau [Candidatus Dormibacteraeota bacterium]|nr:DNA polymerase III subunit gamma/tau [Candidatus Dormibacteraeota bacterium]
MTDVPIQAPPHQAIYRRWRAQTFAQVVGQEAVVETLRNAARTDRVAHAILFVGPRGTGKTSLARILAKAINCTNLQDGDPCDACPSCVAIREGRAMDLLEIDAASNRGIDAIRDLRERINYAPTDLKRKVYILDEAHQITRDAWNALLKSLEEPPPFVVFMFASTHPQEFPPAILSRLQRFDVRRLTTDEIEGKLRRILEADGRTATPAAVHLIARLAAGGMRDAESMLDQLLTSSTDGLDDARVRDLLGLAEAETVAGFVDALVATDARAGMRLLDGLDERGRDLRGFLDQVIETLRAGIIGAAPPAGLAGAGPVAHSIVDLAAAARRLAAIDPSRAGVGGLRLQLELALFPDPATAPRPIAAAVAPAATAAAGERPARPAAPPAAVKPRPAAASDPAPAGGLPTPAPVVAAPTSIAEAPSKGATGPPPVPAVSQDLSVLHERWPEVVTRLSASPPVKPLIAECRPISVEGNVVTLGFPESKAFMKDLLEKRRPLLEEHIGAVLERTVAVRCVATNIDVLPDLPSDEEAAWILAQAQRIFGDDTPDTAEVG